MRSGARERAGRDGRRRGVLRARSGCKSRRSEAGMAVERCRLFGRLRTIERRSL